MHGADHAIGWRAALRRADVPKEMLKGLNRHSMRSYVSPLAAFALIAILSGCGDAWTHASIGPWRKLPAHSLVGSYTAQPEVAVEFVGAGPKVEDGAMVQVVVEVLQPSSYHKGEKPETRALWLWIAWPPLGDLGNVGARVALIGKTVGSIVTVDAKSREPGKRPNDFGSVFLYEGPFGNHKDALIVYDAVYRIQIKEVCPAELEVGLGTYRSIGFEVHCGGEYIPGNCSSSFSRSSPISVYKVTAKCASGTREYVSEIYGMTPEGGSQDAMEKAKQSLRASLRRKNPS